jgi:hypothetical protein
MVMMPWRWFGITTRAPNSTMGKRFGRSSHSFSTRWPSSDKTTASSTTEANVHFRPWVQMVTKYHPSEA